MKNTIKIIFTAVIAMLLASCSTLGISTDNVTDEDTQINNVLDSKAPTAKISLKKSDDDIVATIYTTYNDNPEGSVNLQWTAPKHTKCYDTEFPITKYNETNDKTWASVTTMQGNKQCKGEWSASVMYQGEEIAQDSVSV